VGVAAGCRAWMVVWQAAQAARVLRRLFAMACAHAGCGLPGLVRSASWRTWWISTGPTCPQASHWPRWSRDSSSLRRMMTR
jgi:hypothetical protein